MAASRQSQPRPHRLIQYSQLDGHPPSGFIILGLQFDRPACRLIFECLTNTSPALVHRPFSIDPFLRISVYKCQNWRSMTITFYNEKTPRTG